MIVCTVMVIMLSLGVPLQCMKRDKAWKQVVQIPAKKQKVIAPVRVSTIEDDIIAIPNILVEQLVTLQDMIADLGPEESGEVIPLPNVEAASLNHLIRFHEGTLTVSALSVTEIINLIRLADYLDYKDQDLIAEAMLRIFYQGKRIVESF